MKRSTLRNIAGTVMWFFAGMFLWEYAIKLMVEREERQSRDGGFPVETDDIRRYSDAIYAGMIFDGRPHPAHAEILVMNKCLCFLLFCANTPILGDYPQGANNYPQAITPGGNLQKVVKW